MFRQKKTADIELLNSGFRYALSLAGNQQDAEDLVHDAWIRLDKRYGRFTEKPLLFRTIRNLYIDQYRRRQVVHFVDDYDIHNQAERGDGSAPESVLELQYVAAEELQMALERLRDVEREYLFLAVVEGYTADEVGQMTGTSRGTVLSILHRSKAKLRRILAEESDDDQNDAGNQRPTAKKPGTPSTPDNSGDVANRANVVELATGRTR
ncbi:MAG: RNA polymerase sigma factor [Pseudomonadota bacterium]